MFIDRMIHPSSAASFKAGRPSCPSACSRAGWDLKYLESVLDLSQVDSTGAVREATPSLQACLADLEDEGAAICSELRAPHLLSEGGGGLL